MEISEIEICKEWNSKRMRHPFFAEGLDDESVSRCWEASSRTYTMGNYSRIRGDIVAELKRCGTLRTDRTLLDIGCGPGTYAIPMSPLLKHIDCIDSSAGMISRLLMECDRNLIGNIDVKLSDWNTYVPQKAHDIAFTSLCPPTNSPESMLKMEMCAKHKCVYISSSNKDPELSKGLWERLGKDYSFEGYDTSYPYGFLKEMGRTPKLKMFSDTLTTDRSLDEAVEDEIKKYSTYIEVTDDVKQIIRDTLTEYSEDSRVVTKSEIRAGLLVWSPLD